MYKAPSSYPPFGYTIFRIITHLMIPFATIPLGIVFFYFCTATLPLKDIEIIFYGNITGIWSAIAIAIIIAPTYYIHCLFNRSDLSPKWQLGTHVVFVSLTIGLMYYLCYRSESHHGTWTEESGKLDPFFLFTIPQIIATHVFHWFWVQKYRKSLYLRWFNGIKPKEKAASNSSASHITPVTSNQPKQASIKTREEAQREFDESLELASIQATQNREWLDKLFNFDIPPTLPSFKGKKVWESIIFKQNIDAILPHVHHDKKAILAVNSPSKFCVIDPENGQTIEQIEPQFHETWDDEKRAFDELSEETRSLCEAIPAIKLAYWKYLLGSTIHSSFDPYAFYQDRMDETRLRKTVYFKSIFSKDQTLAAYINKGERYAFIEIRRMSDNAIVQTINTHVPGSHDCRFIRYNTQLIVGCDDGSIKIFDIKTSEQVGQLSFGHNDSVLCLDVNASETELISGSADGIWKIWSILPGGTFGNCLYTSPQLITDHNKPIPIYHTVFCPNGTHLFIVTDIGKIRIYHREDIVLQNTLYDKYQRESVSTNEPSVLSLLIDSDEMCFYVGYANGKMQKWV